MRLRYSIALVCLILLCSFTFARDSGITIEILKPSESDTYQKDQTIDIEVNVIFPSGSTNQKVEVYAGTERSYEKIDLTKNDQGNYVGELELSYEIENMLVLRVMAAANNAEEYYIEEYKEVMLQIEPPSMEIDFELIPPEPYYLGTVIEKIRIDVLYQDGSRMPLEYLRRQPSLMINWEKKRLDLEEDPESGSWIAELNYPIELSEKFLREGTNELRFELLDLEDRYGNIRDMRGIEKEFEINTEHPSLRLRIRNPPTNERIFHNIEIPFEIELTKRSDALNERVFLTDSRDLENKRECQKVKEEGEKLTFQCQERIPSMEEVYRIMYVALATADIAGQEITVYTISENEISNIVHLSPEFPPEREPIPVDEIGNLVKVNFYYSMNAKLEGGSYNGTINDQLVEFVWNPEEGVYIAEFDLKSLGEGQHDLAFSVEGIELENDTVRINFVPEGAFGGFDGDGMGGSGLMFIIVLIVAVLAVFTFIIWFLVLRKKKEETIGELKEEAVILKELLKRIEIDYYKRRLNETEYKKRNLEYQIRLEKITAQIKAKEIKEEKKG